MIVSKQALHVSHNHHLSAHIRGGDRSSSVELRHSSSCKTRRKIRRGSNIGYCNNAVNGTINGPISAEEVVLYEEEGKVRKVKCEVEVISWRERRVRSEVEVDADVDSVWNALTDYERLADFIPNLIFSARIPCVHPGRIWLEQRGLQRALYWHTEARVVLDLQEFPNSANGHELHFSMVDGDFKKFEGKWSVKPGKRSSNAILSYEINVIPNFNLTAIFMERIIRSDLPVNLLALARRSERNFKGNENITTKVHSGSTTIDIDSKIDKNTPSVDMKENESSSSFSPLAKPPAEINNNWGVFDTCTPYLMAETKIRRVTSCDEEDRISNLPEHLIDSILEPLPVEDAARTSILSKKWRYKWTKMRALLFDEHFFNRFGKNTPFGRNGFIRIINKVLILHTGPISKFVLHIPHVNMALNIFEEVDQWMIILSRNGVKELTIINSNQRYELPSYAFSCLELRSLKLKNCFIKRPLEFKEFLNLEYLDLTNIDFGDNLSGTQINLPELKKLYLVACTHVNNFNIKATKLKSLYVDSCPDAMLLRLFHSPCLTRVGMFVQYPIEDNIRVERMTLVTMLSKLTEIEALTVDGRFFKVMIAQKIPKWLPCAVNSLKRVCLIGFEVGDLDQLEGALFLIRNSPNLESLIVMSLKMESQVIDRYDVGPAADHLEAPNCLDCTLNKLQTVKITDLQGSRPELLFIELLLAHSPSLNKFTIRPSGASDAHKRLDILKDVIQFPRASPKAKIFFLDSAT
ncbi:hypothetical protein LXL04_033515 [Taraxacum kok-saghyz]